jgi:hypothetical protein
MIAQPDPLGDPRQGLFFHQGRAQPTQVALVQVRKTQIYMFGNYQVENAVAEELESLVITAARVTAVSQRLFQ